MSPRGSKKAQLEEVPAPEPSHDEIALRAYEIHESGAGGDAIENWLRAERELAEARYAGVT